MSIFTYIAKNKDGEAVTGTEESPDKISLARLLRKRGHLLISAEAESEKSGRGLKERLESVEIFSRVPLWEKMIFARHLAVMLNAGLSINRSLATLASQTKNRRFSAAIRDVEEKVKAGRSFADALSVHNDIFSDLFINMARVGETSGNLVEVLRLLADQMKKDNELLGRVRGALYYPAVIIAVMIMVGIAMMMFVVPQLADTFKELNVELPLSTKILMSTGTALGAHPFVFIFSLFIFIILSIYFLRSRSGSSMLAYAVTNLPIVGEITIKINSARLSRILGSLLRGGVPVVQAVVITSQTLTNPYYRASLASSVKIVEKGEPLSKALSSYSRIYPPLVIQMLQVGEETGTSSEVLEQLAEFYEEEVAVTTKSISTVIEPVLMVLIGIAVGFFAISMIQPMYSMIGGL